MHDDHVVGTIIVRRALNHALEFRTFVKRAGHAGIGISIDEIQSPTLAIGLYRADLIRKRKLSIGLP